MVFTRRLSYAAPIVRVEKQNKIGMERNMTGQHRMIEIAHRRRTEVRCPTCGSFTFSVQDRHFNRMRRFPLLACKERELLSKSGKTLVFSGNTASSLERNDNANMKYETIENGSDAIQEKRQLTPAELRAIEAEKRAAMRQARMKALEEDAMKAQVVIAQVKALSSSSLEGSSVSDTDRPNENSLFA